MGSKNLAMGSNSEKWSAPAIERGRSLVRGLVRGIFDIRSLVFRLTGLSSPWSGFSDFSNHRKDYQTYRCKQDGVEYGHSKVSQNQ
jgi:hypothetical protein